MSRSDRSYNYRQIHDSLRAESSDSFSEKLSTGQRIFIEYFELMANLEADAKSVVNALRVIQDVNIKEDPFLTDAIEAFSAISNFYENSDNPKYSHEALFNSKSRRFDDAVEEKTRRAVSQSTIPFLVDELYKLYHHPENTTDFAQINFFGAILWAHLNFKKLISYVDEFDNIEALSIDENDKPGFRRKLNNAISEAVIQRIPKINYLFKDLHKELIRTNEGIDEQAKCQYILYKFKRFTRFLNLFGDIYDTLFDEQREQLLNLLNLGKLLAGDLIIESEHQEAEHPHQSKPIRNSRQLNILFNQFEHITMSIFNKLKARSHNFKKEMDQLIECRNKILHAILALENKQAAALYLTDIDQRLMSFNSQLIEFGINSDKKRSAKIELETNLTTSQNLLLNKRKLSHVYKSIPKWIHEQEAIRRKELIAGKIQNVELNLNSKIEKAKGITPGILLDIAQLGILNYQLLDGSHLNFLLRIFDSQTGKKRAEYILNILGNTSYLEDKKLFLLLGYLYTSSGKTLKTYIVNEFFKRDAGNMCLFSDLLSQEQNSSSLLKQLQKSLSNILIERYPNLTEKEIETKAKLIAKQIEKKDISKVDNILPKLKNQRIRRNGYNSSYH